MGTAEYRDQGAIIDYLREENRVLRELIGDKRLPLTGAQRRRLAIRAKSVPRSRLLELGPLVTPGTLLRWFRRLVAVKYDSSKQRRGGRAPKPQELRELVVRLARDNDGWAYTKIRDVVRPPGHDIGRTTVRRILQAADLQPSPERLKHMPWATFLKAHWGAVAAMDFFQVEVLTLTGPVRYAVLVVMDLESRRVEVVGIVQDAYEEWMAQMVRNLTDAVDGLLLGKTHLIMDRDPLFSRDFRDMLAHAGVQPVRLPRRSYVVSMDLIIERGESLLPEGWQGDTYWSRWFRESLDFAKEHKLAALEKLLRAAERGDDAPSS